MATDCARRGIGSTGEKWTSFVILPLVSGWSITAGLGSKESEGDLLRVIAIPFDVLEGVVDATERRLSSTRQSYCVGYGMVMGIGCLGCSSQQMHEVLVNMTIVPMKWYR